MKLKKSGAGAMTTAKKAVFIGLYFENCCLVGGGRELTLGWGECSRGGFF